MERSVSHIYYIFAAITRERQAIQYIAQTFSEAEGGKETRNSIETIRRTLQYLMETIRRTWQYYWRRFPMGWRCGGVDM